MREVGGGVLDWRRGGEAAGGAPTRLPPTAAATSFIGHPPHTHTHVRVHCHAHTHRHGRHPATHHVVQGMLLPDALLLEERKHVPGVRQAVGLWAGRHQGGSRVGAEACLWEQSELAACGAAQAGMVPAGPEAQPSTPLSPPFTPEASTRRSGAPSLLQSLPDSIPTHILDPDPQVPDVLLVPLFPLQRCGAPLQQRQQLRLVSPRAKRVLRPADEPAVAAGKEERDAGVLHATGCGTSRQHGGPCWQHAGPRGEVCGNATAARGRAWVRRVAGTHRRTGTGAQHPNGLPRISQ